MPDNCPFCYREREFIEQLKTLVETLRSENEELRRERTYQAAAQELFPDKKEDT